MTVGQLGRVADVLRGDGVHALLEQLVVGAARDHDPEAERGQHGEPQGVVLVHAQDARDADVPTGGVLLAQAAVAEGPRVLVLVEVGQVGLGGAPLLGDAALAAVAGDVALAVVEGGDRELAVVLAQHARVGLGGQREPGELTQAHEGGGLAVVGGVGGECGAEGTHEAGHVRTHHLAAGEELEGAQHGVVEEGAALDAHPLTELVRVLEPDDLVQGVAHHRVAQARTDLAHAGGFLLCLLDRGVHEDGAAAAQVHRVGGGHGGVGEVLDGGAHGLGEGLQEGAATGGAGLVDRDRVDGPVADTQILHVLAADVDDAGDAGVEVVGGPVVGHGLHHALVDAQGGLDQGLPVAGDAGADDRDVVRHLAVDAAQDLDGGGDRVALVAGVVLPDDPVRGIQDHGLDGGGAGVDAQETLSAGGSGGGRGRRGGRSGRRGARGPGGGQGGGVGPGGAWDPGPPVALGEGPALVVVGKEGTHPGGAQVDGLAGGQTRAQLGKGHGAAGGEEGGAHGHVELGVGGAGEGRHLVSQGALEGDAQLGQEVQGTAQEHDVAADGASAGEASDRLGDHGLEHRGGQVRRLSTLVDEGLEVGLGEHPAA